MDTPLFETAADRIRVRDALYHALRWLQTPYDISWDHVITRSAGNAAIKTLIDLGIFKKRAEEEGGQPITCTKLAALTGGDETLIQRMMRCIAGQHLIIQNNLDTYARTHWATALATDQGLRAWYSGFYYELISPLLRTLPDFLRALGYQNPTDNANSNFQPWQGRPDLLFFQYISSNPRLTGDFNDAMEGSGVSHRDPRGTRA